METEIIKANYPTKSAVKSQAEIIAALKKQAESNAMFNAVCYMFAIRKRSRNQITLKALGLKMKKEGYSFPDHKYEAILRFLAGLGIGTLTLNSNKKVVALIGIKITLQSIGQAALDKAQVLQTYKLTNKYHKLIPIGEKFTPEQVETIPKWVSNGYATELRVVINGTVVTYPGPTVSPEDLGTLLVAFKDLSKKSSTK